MSNQQFEKLVSNLKGVMRCPHCSGQYQISDIHYLGQMDSMTFLHMRCEGCQTPVFASIALANEEGEIQPADIVSQQVWAQTPEDITNSDQQPYLPFARKQLDSLTPISDMTDIPVEDATVARVLDAALAPVCHNDVLDVHQYLDTFAGDFEQLLGRA